MGVPLAAFVIPDSPQLSEAEWREMVGGRRLRQGRARARPRQISQVAAIAERYDLPLLDLLPVLQQESGGDPRPLLLHRPISTGTATPTPWRRASSSGSSPSAGWSRRAR